MKVALDATGAESLGRSTRSISVCVEAIGRRLTAHIKATEGSNLLRDLTTCCKRTRAFGV